MGLHTLMLVSNPVTYDPRVRAEARSLIEHGYRVTVLGWDGAGQAPPEEVIDGARVLRLSNTRYMRLLPYDLLRLRPWWRAAYRRATKLHQEDPFDVMHCHDLDTLPVGVRWKLATGSPLLYDAHEIWGYMVAKDLPSSVASYFLWKEKRLVRHTDQIVTVSEPVKAYFEGIASSPMTVVLNAKPVQATEYQPPDNPVFTVLYIGALNRTRFVLESVEAVATLEGVRLLVGGIGKAPYVASLEARSREIENVEFLGRVPHEDVLPLTSRADAVLAMFDPNDKLTRLGLPNKLFEAMATGRPILVSRDTYLAKFITREGVGLAVEHSKEGVREGLKRLRDDADLRETLGRQALKRAVEEFSWERQQERLLDVYESTVP